MAPSKRRPESIRMPSQLGLTIPQEEQWRLINESGIAAKMDTVPKPRFGDEDEDEALAPFVEEIFNAVLLIIPMSFCLLLMDILIHHQYAQALSAKAMMDRLLTGVPILSVFVFYTARHKQTRRMQAFLLVCSIAAGTRLIWMVNKANWLDNMQQNPPLATIWIYTIIQLDLPLACLGLALVGAWSWWAGMKATFK